MELEEFRELERRVNAEAEALGRSMQQAGDDLNHKVRQLERGIEQTAAGLGKAQP